MEEARSAAPIEAFITAPPDAASGDVESAPHSPRPRADKSACQNAEAIWLGPPHLLSDPIRPGMRLRSGRAANMARPPSPHLGHWKNLTAVSSDRQTKRTST